MKFQEEEEKEFMLDFQSQTMTALTHMAHGSHWRKGEFSCNIVCFGDLNQYVTTTTINHKLLLLRRTQEVQNSFTSFCFIVNSM